jgi:hypothetical protein
LAVAGIWAPPAAAQAFDPSNPDDQAYVRGNVLFLTYHEIGHVVLDQLLKADQISQRLEAETTADDIATWLMLPDPDEPEQDEEIWAAMKGWLNSARTQTALSRNRHYPDDAERAARIACYLHGSNPDLYPELKTAFRNSLASVDCVEEFEVLGEDLSDWLEPHLVTDTPSGRGVRVQYLKAERAMGAAQAYLQASGILEEAAEDLSEFVQLPKDVTVVARSCGSGAAEFRYSPSAQRITACYEAVAWFMNDAAAGDAGEADGAGEDRADDMGSGGARVTRRPRIRR